MRFWGTLAFGAALAGAGLAYYVHERSQTSGESYLEIVRQLPAETRRTWSEARRRGAVALESGLQAARRREVEVDRELTAAGSAAR